MPAKRMFSTFFGFMALALFVGCTSHTAQAPSHKAAKSETPNLQNLLAARHVDLPECSDCRVEGEGWRSSRDGDLLMAANGTVHLRLLLVPQSSSKAAQAYVNMQGVILRSSYRTIPSPYRAMISEKVTCSKEFRPVVKGQGDARFLLTAVNARFAFGVCARAEAKFWSGIRYYYDKSRGRVLKVEWFVPLGKTGETKLEQLMAKLEKKSAAYKNLVPDGIKAKI